MIHFGRASNVYMLVGRRAAAATAAAAGQMVRVGGRRAWRCRQAGMQRMASPEIVAQANPDVILMTEFGYDRLGWLEGPGRRRCRASPRAAPRRPAASIASAEHELMYFGPRPGKSTARSSRS